MDMKNTFWKLVILVFIGSLVSCSFLFDNKSETGQHENSQTGTNATISSQYWGTWIQMDTGTEYYIDNQDIYKLNSGSKTKIQSGISGYILESDEILKKDNTVFFRKGGKTRSFSTTISGFSHSTNNSVRAASSISGEIRGKRKNQENSADVETVVSTDGITVQFKGGVADDSQVVTISQGEESGTATVNPKYDGENMGSIPIVEAGKYAFKTTYVVSNADSQGFMYGNNLGVYDISFNITNIGEETCATSVYTISWNDINLSSSDLVREGNFTSIEPGSAKVITGSFIYGYFDEEYKDVTITISVTDSKYEKTWNDYITLRFYKGWVNFKVNTRNFNSTSKATLNGFIVYPDGRSKRFTVSSGNTSTIDIPWSTKDYYIVFSGANNDTEMCYSFVATDFGEPADLSGVWPIAEINAYETNDSIQTATSITNYSTPVKAYLKNGDIDYFKINTMDLKCSKGVLDCSEMYFTESPNDFNNGDRNINPGETIWMDVVIHNSSGKSINNIVVEASSQSQYITFINSSANYGNVNARNYQSYYGYSLTKYKNIGFSSSTEAKSYHDSGITGYVTSDRYPFKFTIQQTCPINTNITINIKMIDDTGSEWTDKFDITVVKSNTDLEYSEYKFTDSISLNNNYNNNDDCINPGETIWMDIKVHNKGTSRAKKVQIIASSNSEFINFTTTTSEYGTIDPDYYQTYYGYKTGYAGTGYSSVGTNSSTTNIFNVTNYAPFKFSISHYCPIDTVIPIILTMTDVNGYEWTDSFNIKIVEK